MEDFQDLVDELSGTTLDGDGTNNNKVHTNFVTLNIEFLLIFSIFDLQDSVKTKSIKPVNRTASIINRSKLLMLDSDSESEDDEMGSVDKKRCSKHIRVSKQKTAPNGTWRSSGHIHNATYSKVLSKGKRKRNSTADALHHGNLASTSTSPFTLHPENLFAAGPSGLQNESMDVECDHHEGGGDSDVSDSNLSEDSPAEFNFDGDDEQSDFHDASSAGHASSARHRNRIYSHTRSKEFKIPTNPSNPFWSVADLDANHSSSISLWKRRRPLNYWMSVIDLFSLNLANFKC